jgi:hypothetical protein
MGLRFRRTLGAAMGGIIVLSPAALARADAAAAAPTGAPTTAARLHTDAGQPAEADVAEVARLWRDLAVSVNETLAASRPILLGDRDPRLCSCVSFLAKRDGAWALPRHARGGIGTRLVWVCLPAESRRSPLADFTWHQTELRPLMERLKAQNAAVLVRTSRLADQAEALARKMDAWAAVPADFPPSGVSPQDHWPGHCIKALDIAIARGDLALAKQWAKELASAAYGLCDLHRWINLLVDDELTALAFQARGRSLFADCEGPTRGAYDSKAHLGQFPGGSLTMPNLRNFLEVEHQAEWLFQTPQEYLELTLDGDSCAKTDGLTVTGAAVWMPPHVRGLFARLRANLSRANQQTWDRAAHTPFERSYLVNMLFQAQRSGTAVPLGLVLKRFDALQPQAPLSSLMSVIFCNGGNFEGGSASWHDRYDRRLLAAAAQLTGDNENALLTARRLTNRLFGRWENYQPVPDLSTALSTGKMDCVTATGIIAGLFRNSGRAPFYNVRWCSGVRGHTVAAAERVRDGAYDIVLVDGLDFAQKAVETWSSAYVDRHPWPAGGPLEDAPPPYAAELYARALDSYVWVEGYIVRGPHAGTFMRADLPYLRPPTGPALAKAPGGTSAPPGNRTP